MAILSKADILQPRDAEIYPVEVPEWGGTAYIRVPSSAVLDRFQNRQAQLRDQGIPLNNFHARIGVLVLCDEQGNLLFTDADESDLSHQSAKALKRVFDAAKGFLGLTDDVVEEEAKNLQPTSGGDSTTD